MIKLLSVLRIPLRWLLDLLFPPRCMLCQRFLPNSKSLLCGKCHLDLPEHYGELPSVKNLDTVVTPFFYEPPIRDAVLRFKFQGMASYADQFAQWMAIWVRDKLEGKYDYITWVPCSRRRRWSRGFDQAKLLAVALGRELNVPARPTLRKVRHTQKQSLTPDPALRRANVLGAYETVLGAPIRGKRILLVDDVLTTGATLSECGKILRAAGAESLVGAAIALARHDKKK